MRCVLCSNKVVQTVLLEGCQCLLLPYFQQSYVYFNGVVGTVPAIQHTVDKFAAVLTFWNALHRQTRLSMG